MKILVGSNNPTKIQAVKNVFAKAEVGNIEVFSKVSAQPFRTKKRWRALSTERKNVPLP